MQVLVWDLPLPKKLIELQGGTLFFESIQEKEPNLFFVFLLKSLAEEQEKKSHMYQELFSGRSSGSAGKTMN